MSAIRAIGIAATLLLGAAGVAHAADLIVDEPAAMEIADVADVDWSGAYIGASVGMGAGTVSYDGNYSGEYDVDGWVAGVQAGYNVQSGNLVYGIEGDLNWSDITGENPTYSGYVYRDINWTGSLRGRLGFAVSSLLFYGTAGVAFANSTGVVGSTEITETHTGWTAGLGVAAKLTDDVSAFVEYDYADYGTKFYDYGTPEVDTGFTTGTVKVGLNWHF